MVKQTIKVAYILTPITFGGSEKVSLNFLHTVSRRRFDIHPVLLTRPWEPESYFAGELRNMGYSYETVPVADKRGEGPMRVARVAGRFHSILKNGAFDVLHTHGYFADICGLPVARLLGIRSLSTCHGFIGTDSNLKLYNRLDVLALRLCDTVIAVSDDIKEELERKGVKASRIEVIPNAVKDSFNRSELLKQREKKREELSITTNDFLAGYVGRLSEEKGLVYLFGAISQLSDAGDTVKLLIVGDGPERAALQQKAVAMGIDGLIHFAGFRSDIENWLPAIDAFILPSLTEGTPLALLEAMAMEVPVIASSVGGVPRVVADGVNGLLVSPGDIQAISESIKLLNDNAGLRRQLGLEGRDTISAKYGVDRWRYKIENCYIRACPFKNGNEALIQE